VVLAGRVVAAEGGHRGIVRWKMCGPSAGVRDGGVSLRSQDGRRHPSLLGVHSFVRFRIFYFLFWG
jgi:hypothetical protein